MFYICLRIKTNAMTTYRAHQIETLANGRKVSTCIEGVFTEKEYMVVRIDTFVSAFFLMDNETFNYTYSHTYNAITDKTTRRKPKGF